MPTLTLLLTGLSSTGKTTLSRLLTHIFPSVTILHQDDFYHTDSEIPVHPTLNIADWDCPAAFNFVDLASSIRDLKAADPGINVVRDSITAASPVDAMTEIEVVGGVEVVEMLRRRVKVMGKRGWRIVVVEGILMLCVEEVEKEAEVKVLLRVGKEVARKRREGREGYVTIEGFWKDPPRYFDEIVWPNYAIHHAPLFVNHDVEGALDESVTAARGIVSPPDLEWSLREILEWLVGVILEEMVRIEAEVSQRDSKGERGKM
ncbi:P-loop containing nucleoside triphosphate hydrolase protein [Ascodesmis nigricans]|uniref:P-loop containing nucleoside triphosphate hydrolase protein n=1 Tax=Ascodesmis nigricans TaxID=341454 RepID=A0A4S2MTE9_9PEZI|nr:P-loop containing nucleoside triphosphate hydrolase protein [Ascodesmis nigricans]